ncbi:peptidoglycan-binding protein [Acetobacter sacchari]|uniref:Peptidoglycan-binding protein n=1 Tax=Acetobacter sacchari TaxID=2661687 RepID=A0ABS3LRM1_9PROT|nr:peptidoglycan-binding domain-containing protein [Acetobacter sacchari]MBO1358572.1 peptidoglycan-binding protein [Acetobacter sacchari]
MMFRPLSRLPRRASFAALLLGAALGGSAYAEPVSATLINLPTVETLPKLSGCAAKMPLLQASLKAAGVPTRLLESPDANGVRAAMMAASLDASRTPQLLVVCGYGAVRGGRLFLLPSGTPIATEDLSRGAMSATAFSRIVQPNGGVILDLHPLSADPPLGNAVAQWRSDPAIGGRKLGGVDEDANGASVIDTLITTALRGADAFFPGVFLPAAASPQPYAAGSSAAGGALAGAPAAAAVTSQGATTPSQVAPSGAPAPAKPATPVVAPPPVTSSPEAVAGATKPAVITPPPAPAPSPVPVAAAEEKPAAAAEGSAASAPSVAAAAPVAPPPKRVVPPKTDPAVRNAQLALLAKGFYSGQVTGYDSAATHAAIKRLQAVLGHPVTGKLSPEESQQLMGE